MKRSAGWCGNWRLAVCLVLSPSLLLSACVTVVGVSPSDIPPCPQSVITEALLADAACWSDEALSDLVNLCDSLEVLRD